MAACRKCLKWVSKIGMAAAEPPPSTTIGGDTSPNKDSSSNSTKAAWAVVIVATLVALIGIGALVVVLRRKRIREERLNNNNNNNNNAHGVAAGDKGASANAAQNGEEERIAQAMGLVVMAGETTPTFVAHPVPAPGDTDTFRASAPIYQGPGNI